MKWKMLSALLVVFAAKASMGQLLMPIEGGEQKISYGSRYDKGYKGQNTANGYADFGMSFVILGHSQRTHGVNFVVGADVMVPFSNADNTGGVVSFGGNGQANFRYRMVSLSGGIDIHQFLLQSDTNNGNNRPNQLLVSTPIMAKVNFGPGQRAYVQAGGAFVVASDAQTTGTDSFGNTVTVSNATFALSSTRQSGDIRASAGYTIKRVTMRANYLHRDVYFDVQNNPTYASYYDFHEHLLSAGIVLTVF